MSTLFQRRQIFKELGQESCFLWGPRQTGKSTLLRQVFPSARYVDLLLADEYERLNRDPTILRQEIIEESDEGRSITVVDEVQKVPALLDEIQWLIVNKKCQFILCGSSARKLKRGSGNLLGGRAIRYELFPFVFPEIPDFNLKRALNHGLIPRHYLAEVPGPLIHAYVGEYLKEEIAAEALTRNIPAFTRFLEAASFSNGQMVNFQNVARECGVSPPTVKEYFQILEDTMIGRFIPVFQRRPKRRVIQAPRFYFFDVGITNFLLKRGEIDYRGEAFGRAFEHLIFQELVAHAHYSGKNYPVSYWRTASQLEVDFVLGDHEIAVEVKGVNQADVSHGRGLRAFREEYDVKKLILVTLDPRPRKMGEILVLPWKVFLERLWRGEIIS